MNAKSQNLFHRVYFTIQYRTKKDCFFWKCRNALFATKKKQKITGNVQDSKTLCHSTLNSNRTDKIWIVINFEQIMGQRLQNRFRSTLNFFKIFNVAQKV